jgi:polyisoprenoid-binding protein YceI
MKTALNRTALQLFAALVVLASIGTLARGAEYKLDPSHSRIGFSIGHLGLSTVDGRFTNYTGKVTIENSDMKTLEAEAVIKAASIDTGWKSRDEHVKGKDFLHVKEYPEIKFEADTTRKKEDQWYLVGTFSMHGVSRKLDLKVNVKGPVEDPWGNKRIGLHAEGEINRHDFNVDSDKMSDNMVGDKVTLEITLEATRK